MIDTMRLSIVLAFQAPLICLVICGYVFFALNRNGVTRRQYFLIRVFAVVCILSMLFEIASGAILYCYVRLSSKFVPYFYTAAYCCLWIETVAMSEFCMSMLRKRPRRSAFVIRGLYGVVALILISRLVFSETELFTYFDVNDAVKFGPLDDIQTWGCMLIDAAVTILMLVRYCDKSEYAYRERYGKMLAVTLLITLTVALYSVTYLPYIIPIGHMLTLVFLYLSLQGMMIYRDELTTLNNRRCMLMDINEKIKFNSAWSYMIADVNDFKHINDTYGHNEGDRALTIIASVLKEIAIVEGASAYRLGGDEFAMVIPAESGEEAGKLCEKIDQRLGERAIIEDLKYDLTLSCGYAVFKTGSPKEIPAVMEEADAMMYANKQEKKQRSGNMKIVNLSA